MPDIKEPGDWPKDLEFGEMGEIFISFSLGWTRSPKKVREYDLMTPTGETVELKTDRYKYAPSPVDYRTESKNMFMEEISNKGLNTLGGPRRAVRDEVSIFGYLFWPNKKLFLFRSRELLSAVDFAINGLSRKTKENKTYTTEGYAVPVSELEGSAYKTIDFPDKVVEHFYSLKDMEPERWKGYFVK